MDRGIFSPDKHRIALSVGDNVQVWDIETGKMEAHQTYSNNGWGSALAFAPNGETLAIYDNNGLLHLWNVSQKAEQKVFDVGRGFPNKVLFSPNSEMLIIVNGETLSLWDVATGKQQVLLKNEQPQSLVGLDVTEVAVSADGHWLATTGNLGKNVRLWNLASGQQWLLAQFEQGNADHIIFSPDGKTLIYGTYFAAHVVDLASRQECLTIKQQDTYFAALSLSPDGALLASSGYWSDTLRLWEISTGKQQAVSKSTGG